MKSSSELFTEMQTTMEWIEGILKDSQHSADVQIADVDNLCWVLVDLISQFSRAVQNELSDIEGN